MLAAPPPLPPMTELFTKAQLVARHPHLLNVNRVTWALRRRPTNGLSAAIFDSPCGELLIHEPSFLAWFLGPVVMSRDAFRTKQRGRDRFVSRVLKEPKIFVIGDANKLRGLAEDRAA